MPCRLWIALLLLFVVSCLPATDAGAVENVTQCDNADSVEEDYLMCYWIDDEDEGKCEVALSHIASRDRCHCAGLVHENADSIINYVKVHYCRFRSVPELSIVLHAIWAIILFYLLALTADRFLVPVLTILSDMMGLSPNVAGVTVLAFANGAPDVFTSIAAFTGEGGSSDLGVGSLLGVGMFVTSFVLACITIVEPFRTYRRPFLRDLFFYIASIALFFYIAYDHKVELWEAIVFIVWYLVYVVVVVLGRALYQRWKRQRMGALDPVIAGGPFNADGEIDLQFGINGGGGADYFRLASPSSSSSSPSSSTAEFALRNYEAAHKRGREHNRSGVLDAALLDDLGLDRRGSLSIESSSSDFASITSTSFVNSIKSLLGWSERGLLKKLIAPVELPFLLAFKLTIPEVEADTWSRPFTVLGMLCWPHLLLFVFGLSEAKLGVLNLHILVAMASLPCAFLVWRSTSPSAPPKGPLFVILCVVAFVMALIWPFLLANELVDVLVLIGDIAGVSEGVLGVTVLAMGNSLGDLIANVSLARDGQPRMAAAGCFGGPLFNLLFGAGLAFLIVTIKQYPEPFVLESSDQAGVGFAFLAASLAASLFVVPLNKFQISRNFGRFLLILYVAYLMMAVLVETGIVPAF